MGDRIFVVAGPSGSGKSTLVNRALNEMSVLYDSLSDTTREPRQGEIDGVHYNFKTLAEFEAGVRQGRYLEFAKYAGNFYGTSEVPLIEAMERGRVPLMILERNGCFNVRDRFGGGVVRSIFILPPKEEDLIRRINSRGEMNPDELAERLSTIREEVSYAVDFDYCVRNREGEGDVAYEVLSDIITREIKRAGL